MTIGRAKKEERERARRQEKGLRRVDGETKLQQLSKVHKESENKKWGMGRP